MNEIDVNLNEIAAKMSKVTLDALESEMNHTQAGWEAINALSQEDFIKICVHKEKEQQEGQ